MQRCFIKNLTCYYIAWQTFLLRENLHTNEYLGDFLSIIFLSCICVTLERCMYAILGNIFTILYYINKCALRWMFILTRILCNAKEYHCINMVLYKTIYIYNYNMLILQVKCVSKVPSRERLWTRKILFGAGLADLWCQKTGMFGRLEIQRVKRTIFNLFWKIWYYCT